MLKGWRTERSEIAFSGDHTEVTIDDVVGPCGRRRYETVKYGGDCVVVIPVLGNEKIVIVSQYRHTVESFTLELPKGRIRPGEDKSKAALRELSEETGYSAKNLLYLGHARPQIARADQTAYAFLASGLEPGEQNLDPTETDLEVHLLTETQISKMILSGKINDGITHSAWLLYLMTPSISRKALMRTSIGG